MVRGLPAWGLGAALIGAGLLLFPQSSHSNEGLFPFIQSLRATQVGSQLVQRAIDRWGLGGAEELVDMVSWGEVSKTDSVLVRRYDPNTMEETQERKVTISLRANQMKEDILFDLAHELAHATQDPQFDPYDPNLSPGKYILGAIEGEGGEVDAVMAECQVAYEVKKEVGALRGARNKRCSRYLTEDGVDRKRVLQDFYLVGDWKGSLVKGLAQEAQSFPLLSTEAPNLVSSLRNMPYPVALMRDYYQMTRTACENALKRLEAFQLNRFPSSKAHQTRVQEVSRFLAKRCSLN